jgi:methionyl-tRNA formyltransferase
MTANVFILTGSNDRHYYFCNQLIKNLNVVGVITDAKTVYNTPIDKLKKKLCRKNLSYNIRNMLLNALFRKYGNLLKKEKEFAENEAFRGSKEIFQEKHSGLLVARVDSCHKSVNNPHYIDLVRSKKPDVIAVMGTCLLGKHLISSAQHVLNMHTGLSPYYRGGYTNLWPILEEDFGFFGVTIHRMSLGIDSGDIIFTKRPTIYPADNFSTVNTRCIKIGTELMIRAIRLVESGKVAYEKQWIKGKLFLNRDMNNYIAYRYFKMKDRFFEKYCELDESNKLPELRIIGDADKNID